MSDKAKDVVFINRVLNQGIHDGAFNINFGTYLFTPITAVDETTGKQSIVVDPDLVMSLRLRMGEAGLRELKSAVDYLVGLADEERRKQTGEIPATVSEATGQSKPN